MAGAESFATGPRRTGSPNATEALGAELAASLRAGDVVTVSGELGAGKSTLIRGAVRKLGVVGAVASPSFTLGRRYAGERVDVSHLDLYRLSSLDGEDPSLLEDYLTDDSISFIEWPEVGEAEIQRAAAANAGRVIEISIAHVGEQDRVVEIK